MALMTADGVPAATGFKLAKVFNEIKANLDAFNKIQEQIVAKHAVRDADGKPITLPNKPEAIALTEEGGKELEAVYEISISLNIEKIPVDTLNNVQMKPINFAQLDWLLA